MAFKVAQLQDPNVIHVMAKINVRTDAMSEVVTMNHVMFLVLFPVMTNRPNRVEGGGGRKPEVGMGSRRPVFSA